MEKERICFLLKRRMYQKELERAFKKPIYITLLRFFGGSVADVFTVIMSRLLKRPQPYYNNKELNILLDDAFRVVSYELPMGI